MIIRPEEIALGDIIKLAEYDPLKRIGYVKFYETLDDLINFPFIHYVSDPLNPTQYLYTLVLDINVRPKFRSLSEEIRAVKILYKTKAFWTEVQNVTVL
jgi:hypothetical protein